MRALLIHNPKAGESDPSPDALMRMLREAGFDPVYRSSKDPAYREALREPWELVVVAGGDGTVAEVGNGLEGRDTPMTVIPLGTANNLAAALGIEGETEALIRGLRRPRQRSLRSATARGGWGERVVWEGAGVGFFPALMAALAKEKVGDGRLLGRQEVLRAHLLVWAAELASAEPIEVRGSIDGETFEGRFLMVEALLIPTLGPAVPLAPAAEPESGRLHLVRITPDDRDPLLRYLEARINGREATVPSLDVVPATRVRLAWTGSPARLDDERWPKKGSVTDAPGEMEIEAGTGSLTIWVPAPSDSR